MVKEIDEKDFKETEFGDLLDKTSREIDIRESGRKVRGGWGAVVDWAILARQAIQQVWQFIVFIQAFIIFTGLLPNVTTVLNRFLDEIIGSTFQFSTMQIGIAAFGSIAILIVAGFVLLLYGGTLRHSSLINKKQDPGMRMNYEAYRIIMKRLDELEKKETEN